MNAPIVIPASEHGVVRVFHLSERLAAMLDHGETLEPLEQALGSGPLGGDHVQIVPLRQLDNLGLAGLLEQGHGIAHATLAADRARLAALTGTVAILRSRAFGSATTLQPTDDCPLIATFGEEAAPPPRFEPLPAGGAQGILPGGRTDDDTSHRASRRTLLIGLAAALVLAVIVLLITRSNG